MRFDPLVEQSLLTPESLPQLSLSQWDRLICSARRAGLLARIHALLADRALLDSIPSQPRLHLESARVVADHEQCIMRWEIGHIRRVLRELKKPVVFLKGAAYLLGELPLARGRISSDIDILVEQADLADVEALLLKHGWEHVKIEDYDQYYYRAWSHELPPLRHRERHTTIDVHHTILPLTGRCHPDAKKLLAEAIALGDSEFKILAPVDMVLHSAAHAFQDGDLLHGMRDLVDLDDLFRTCGSGTDFWERLLDRGVELELTRPLYYALRYSNLILRTPIPKNVLVRADRFAPMRPARLIMDRLVSCAVNDPFSRTRQWLKAIAAWALYMRQHWLRMPPWLLARHLWHQMWRPQKLRSHLG